jgi:hypothetical protein
MQSPRGGGPSYGTLRAIDIASAAPARADQTFVAKVPFDFIAGGSRLPAGDYVVAGVTGLGVVSIASADAEHFAFVLASPVRSNGPAPRSELVFEQFGGEHFLARCTSSDGEGREILLTPEIMERALQTAVPANR